MNVITTRRNGRLVLAALLGVCVSATPAFARSESSQQPCASSAAAERPIERETRMSQYGDARHNHFQENAPIGEYRLPVAGQVLIPREGQSELNGPHGEGVPPANSEPMRLSSS